ncbi:unnamed protein product [Echinostoma caproni]|uniref:Peptidoglycan recognition protein family domain-containing protein n=1 Tax=Echinostoma caproni TaxID=27848 RepID=A0A3P8HMK0_9TREM|nr:unnamed protein product [Echinostoma caproni]
MHCRVQLDNHLKAIGEPDLIEDDWNVNSAQPATSIVRGPEQWQEPLCTRRHDFEPLDLDEPLRQVVLHNTYLPRFRCYSHAACVQYIRQAALYHLSQNWKGLGYSYMIGNDGAVYEGRGSQSMGSHTGGYNQISYGVAFFGWYPITPPTVEALNAFWTLMVELREKGFLDQAIRILGSRDIRPSENPGKAIQNWCQTLPRWSTNQSFEHIREIQCRPVTDADNSWLIFICCITVATSIAFFGFGFFIRFLHTQCRIERSLRAGNLSDLLEHTPECTEWSKVCMRVNCNGRIFRALRIQAPTEYQRLNENNVKTTNEMHNEQQASIDSNRTWKEWDVPDFIATYLRPAQINVMLALPDVSNKTHKLEYTYCYGLFVLFCRSWREVLEVGPVTPSLILYSLSALRMYHDRMRGGLGGWKVELVTDTCDFLVLVTMDHEETEYQARISELCRNAPIVVIRPAKNANKSRCLRNRKVTCLKCDLCQPLGKFTDHNSGGGIFGPELNGCIHKIKDGIAKHRTRRGNGQWQLDPYCWFRFVNKQKDYVKLAQPIEDHIYDFPQFKVYEESRHTYEV